MHLQLLSLVGTPSHVYRTRSCPASIVRTQRRWQGRLVRRRGGWRSRPAGLLRSSAGAGVVRLVAVADRDHADGVRVAQLIDDPVGPHLVGPQSCQASAQPMASFGVAFQFTEGVEDRVSQDEVELGEGIARRAAKDDLGLLQGELPGVS